MIYTFNNIYTFSLKILIVFIVTFFSCQKGRNCKKWFAITLISPYFGGISFGFIWFLDKKNKINEKKEDVVVGLILKYELYIIFISFLVLGVILNFSNLI